MKLEDYMTTKEAAELLGVSHCSGRVNQLVKAGMLDGFVIGKNMMVSRESLEAYKLKRGNKKGGRYPSS